ncbi:MAG: RIP metalloprotease RseP [Actinobacteria bacterium]|nr:RIP metalloprotease RseP [Actinomycetota bacterium]
MHWLTANLLLGETSLWLTKLGNGLSQAFGISWPVVLLIFGFGMLIFVHELGHFLAAKLVGIKVEVFALGFGPRIFGFKRGETDYRLSAIPLGGYIKMLGQDDLHPENRVDDERAFCSKSVGRRFVVIAAGVVMNIICALALFVILFRFTGVSFQRPQVGAVFPDSAAEKAGVLPGDTILAVNGKAIRDFGELSTRIALSHAGQDVVLTIQRPGRAKPLRVIAQLEAGNKDSGGVPHIGILGPQTLTVYDPGDYAGEGGLKKGDVIIGLEFDGKRHYYQKYYQFAEAINARRDKPTNIIASRDGKELEPVMVRPHLLAGSHVMGLIPPTRITRVMPASPAEKAGVKPGDVIASFDNHPWPDFWTVAKIAQLAGEKGQEVPLTVLRSGKIIKMQVKPRKKHKEGSLGIEREPDYQNLYVAHDYPELYEEKENFAGLNIPANQKIYIPPGAELLSLNGRHLVNWSDLIDKLQARAGSVVELTYSLNGEKNSLSFAVPSADSPVWRKHWRFYALLLTKPDEIKVKSNSLPGAMYIGLHKTWFWMQNIYLTITRIAQGSVKTEALAGPLGIFDLSIRVARERGPAHFFYFMAIIGVNLAIINFLPIPVLDGGHALFLLLEKIKGSPVSIRVQSIATTIGMAAIGAFFLLVTYNDIARMVRSWFG